MQNYCFFRNLANLRVIKQGHFFRYFCIFCDKTLFTKYERTACLLMLPRNSSMQRYENFWIYARVDAKKNENNALYVSIWLRDSFVKAMAILWSSYGHPMVILWSNCVLTTDRLRSIFGFPSGFLRVAYDFFQRKS